ncbi:hypothetical protein BDV26DRAFT_251285 [Aspergillus bertholletiae]|uniref:Uncharacterized protein n=1 Tax=Aspergillus bertholletiae TaxID=1226010 RepID=A0A5N7BP97_9EURO|nr:hypothetical protein BDV26DRAFT_251285 [Aspergillus bertholletiae]
MYMSSPEADTGRIITAWEAFAWKQELDSGRPLIDVAGAKNPLPFTRRPSGISWHVLGKWIGRVDTSLRRTSNFSYRG